jgi:hypothetical protein
MAVYKEVPTTQTVEDPVAVERPIEPVPPVTTEKQEYHMNLAARIISLIGGVLLTLLAIRFVLILLGANPLNGFANFIYSVTHPFVAPFFGLFNYDQTLGRAQFEVATLVAMLVYGLLTVLLTKIVTIRSRRPA